MITTRNTIFSLFIFISLFYSFCDECEKNHITEKNQNENAYWGDFTLSHTYYWKKLVKGKTYQILKKQNSLYQNTYTKIQPQKISLSKNLIIKLTRVKTTNQSDIKINLYTYIGNKKIDSIQFYRSVSGNEFGHFNSLSYFNPNTHKIWQIQYFPINPVTGNSVGIVSYTEKNIRSDGKIKTDSLHYLDESLDVEMDKYHLYY